MKKLAALLLISVMSLSIIACGNEPSTNENDAQQGIENEMNSEEDVPEVEPIVSDEELLGLWVSDSGNYFFFEDDGEEKRIWLSKADARTEHCYTDFGWTIEGNMFSFSDMVGFGTYTYEIVKDEDQLSLNYVGLEGEAEYETIEKILSNLTKVSGETVEPVATKEELVGLWAANDDHALKLGEDNTAFFYEIKMEVAQINLAYNGWFIDGDFLSFTDEWDGVYTYKIQRDDKGEISLKYVGDGEFHAINHVCADLTRYTEE